METTTTTTTTTSTDLSINLTGENEKLRKHNHILSLELSRIKKQCQDLMSFLSTACNYDIVKDNNLLIHDMIQGVSGGGPNHDSTSVEICCSTSTDHHQDNMDDDDENDEECRLKLFGVWLKGNNKKRVRRVARKTPTSQNRG
ncbi:hypothetical protein BVC80_1313g67 [Macleaya cordata]|uniref:Uncharacterized protein n=1 Tax=Macleaya cordata TaxID=56857 RepID=A0A200QYY7_MACCD|nr:hypothetical protein BVC80_1313g67 [Macleaya cordata]